VLITVLTLGEDMMLVIKRVVTEDGDDNDEVSPVIQGKYFKRTS
jgi:hypothetical protein